MIHLYRITNLVTKKVYIGQTSYVDPFQRWAVHKSHATRKLETCTKLMRTMRKHGNDKFVFEVVGGAFDQDTANLLEVFLIESYNSIKEGYNIKEGGSNGKHSEETKAKMSNTRRNNPNQSSWLRGTKASDETKQRMSEAHKAIGHKPPPSTPESQAKATAARREKFAGKPRPWSVNKEKPIFVDGFLYPSVKKAAEVLDAEITTLHRNVRHSPTSKRKPKFKCEWLICSPSAPSDQTID